MNFKSFVVLSVFGLSLLSAKSYEIVLDNASRAGNLELKPGHYALSLENSKVRFTDTNNGKSLETDAKVVNVDKKFENTLMDTKQVNGATQINEIDLGGTKTKIEFH